MTIRWRFPYFRVGWIESSGLKLLEFNTFQACCNDTRGEYTECGLTANSMGRVAHRSHVMTEEMDDIKYVCFFTERLIVYGMQCSAV